MSGDRGRVSVVGIGPGAPCYLTDRAVKAIKESEIVVGYRLYIQQVEHLTAGKEIISSSMGREVERCRFAVEKALQGHRVALVSGGDPGVYGMAGLLLQVAGEGESEPSIEIVPGITAASAAAAVLGAPLMHDYASISLSDLLTPWELIVQRLEAAAGADFVIVIYNPRSRGREDLLLRAIEIISSRQESKTAAAIVRAAGRPQEKCWQTTLGELPGLVEEVDMASLVIIGNSRTYWKNSRMITPRGYRL